MSSRTGNDPSAPLRGGALCGALFGAVEARWALPAVEHPLLSNTEWWMTWLSAVALGTSCGLLAGLLVRTLGGGRGGRRSTGLAMGLGAGLPLTAALFLRLRPLFGPEGRSTTLWIAAGGGLLLVLLLLLLDPPRRRRFVILPGVLLALLATLSGWLLSRDRPEAWSREGPRPSSLLLLTVDTTRADHLPPEAEYLDPDGFFRDLQRHAVRVDPIIAPVPLTGPSHASLLTGEAPLVHGAMDNGWMIDAEQPTLAEELRSAGYATGAVLSSAVLHRDLCGLDRGFQEYDDSFRPGDPLQRLVYVEVMERLARYLRGEAGSLSHQRRARETVDLGLRFLERHRDRPFFLWLHFYDPHAPYEPLGPPPPREELPALGDQDEDEEYWSRRRAYAAEIRDLDHELLRLRPELERLGILDETLQVMVSDHGESFGTHGRGYRFDHGAYLFDDVLRLGAWWREPGGDEESTRADIGGMAELGRAIRRRLLGTGPTGADEGPSTEAPPWAHSTVAGDTLWFAVRHPGRKLILGQTHAGDRVFEAYDLERDPGEQRQLLPERRAPSRCEADSLATLPIAVWIEDEEALERHARELHDALSRERPELSEEAKERLRSLGYAR